MKNKDYCSAIVAREGERAQQLEFFSLPQKRQKPQISSTPGISPKERNRYRVMLGNRILGTALTLDEALNLAKRGKA